MNNKFVLADTCFWYALLSERDQYYQNAVQIYDKVSRFNFVLPWPILYEVVNTKFCKDVIILSKFINITKYPSTTRIDDSKYRDTAFEQMELYSLRKKRPISLVDCVIREILKDVDTKIDYFISFNDRDFNDSIDFYRTLLYKE